MDSVTGPPSNISGAMYDGVPATAFFVLMNVLWHRTCLSSLRSSSCQNMPSC